MHRLGRSSRTVGANALRAVGASLRNRSSVKVKLGHIPILPISATDAGLPGIAKRTYAAKEGKGARTATLDLVNAASQGDLASVKRFIEQDGLDVNSADYDKRSVLHLAAAEGRTDVVKYLLSKSVNVNVVDRFNRTPLEDALKGGHTEVAGLLRAKGATASKTQLELTADMCFAAGQGDMKELQILIEAGGDINKTDSVGRTPLHVAAAEGHVTAIEFLVKRGANVNSVDRYGNTALMEAKRGRGRGHRACAKVLEENGGVVSSGPAFTGTNFQTSLQSSLPILCDRGKFLYVQTWLPAKDGQEFIATDWYAQKDFVAHLAGVRVSSDTAEFSDKSSPLFHVYKEKKPVYIPNVAADKSNRYKAAMDSGIRSCVVIPIVHQGDVTAILKFFSDESPQLSDQDLSTFSRFASNLVTAGVYGTSRAPRFNEVKDIPESQMQEVFKMIVDEGVFNANLVYHEVDWFYNMGLQVHYFRVHQARVLANHIHSLIAAKKSAATSGTPEHIWLGLENNPKLLGGSGPEQALYMIPNLHPQIAAVERALSKRIGLIPAHKPYTLEMFLSQRPHTPNGQTKLAIYVLQTNNYVNPSKLGSKETDIWEISSDAFQRDKTKSIRERYQEIINEASPKLSPVAKVYELYRDGTVPIMLAFHKGQGNTSSVMMQLTELLKQQDLEPTRKFIEVFANGIIVFSLYLKPCPQKKIDNLLQQYSLLHLIPYSALTPKFLSGEWTAEEYTYASAVSRFIFYFINQRSEEFEVLSNHLKNDPLNLARLRLLHTSLKREAVSQIRINETLLARADLTKELFRDFQTRVTTDQTQQRLPANAALLKRIKNEATSQLDEQILQAILTFNQHVRKTNFYKQKKSALSFRLDPTFLKGGEWPQVPFGVFFVLGSEFQGFHIRFEDVARGGIRIVRSRDQAAYNKNLGTLFAENYGLAFTQNRKNKDIPEFGSKGTVLLNVDSQAEANAMMSFQKYCSGVLDLIINHKEVRDNLGKPELLFFGPDEGTADKMEWACLYAQRKGYPYWRSFTTGKPPALGGIPHDTYGMTTTSVHKYVVLCLNRLGLDETKVTKIQTGGPDGDLGSNEILLSKDKTKAVIDGSGVLYDEDGINREELIRLAKKRVMIKEFDVKKLGPKGFRVLVTENNVKLPNGDIVENGVAFRNEFHLHPLATADMFVPCGGRPESVNLSNVKQLLHKDGKPKFRIVVEGANLFFTQDARMVLENAGVVLYKDASANKGGVTSSSLEVLAALALDDAEFDKHMAVKDPKRPPAFYEEYVKEIQRRIQNDAELEFKCIWAEHERSGKHRYLLTDEVSEKINTLNKFVAGSKLWDNLDVRTAVLRQAIPQKLQQLKPLDDILQRVPPNYTKAIFAAYLASRYVYQYGIYANEFAFFEFMDQFLKKDK